MARDDLPLWAITGDDGKLRKSCVVSLDEVWGGNWVVVEIDKSVCGLVVRGVGGWIGGSVDTSWWALNVDGVGDGAPLTSFVCVPGASHAVLCTESWSVGPGLWWLPTLGCDCVMVGDGG